MLDQLGDIEYALADAANAQGIERPKQVSMVAWLGAVPGAMHTSRVWLVASGLWPEWYG